MTHPAFVQDSCLVGFSRAEVVGFCVAAKHQKACRNWRKKNPHYDKQDRLIANLVKDGPVSRTDPLTAIDWDAASDKVGPEVAVLVEETGKAICQWTRGERPA